MTKEDLEQMFSYLSHYSFYAYEDEIRQGYLTLEGGHRVGLAGQAVMENEQVKSMRYIYFMNIRVAKEKIVQKKSFRTYYIRTAFIIRYLYRHRELERQRIFVIR